MNAASAESRYVVGPGTASAKGAECRREMEASASDDPSWLVAHDDDPRLSFSVTLEAGGGGDGSWAVLREVSLSRSAACALARAWKGKFAGSLLVEWKRRDGVFDHEFVEDWQHAVRVLVYQIGAGRDVAWYASETRQPVKAALA